MRGTLLPTLNSGRLELPDHPKLVAQLLGLERRVARGGRESIDHGPHGHDDLCNVVAGGVALATARSGQVILVYDYINRRTGTLREQEARETTEKGEPLWTSCA